MDWIILSGVVCILSFIALGFSYNRRNAGWKFRPRQVLCLLAFFLIIPGCFATVPAGHTGIITTFGKVENQTLEAGLHTILPWQKVVNMDNRTQKATINMSCFSSDIQEVEVIYSINYQIHKQNAQELYKTIGVNYYETVMTPSLQQAVKTVMAQYTAESLIASRNELAGKIIALLEPNLQKYNIIVVDTAIENMDFSDVFTSAVEEKQVAEQQRLKAITEQNRLTLEAEAKAEREIIAANAKKDVEQINADAALYVKTKEAEANRELAASLTDTLIKYFEINRWDGKLPAYYVTGADGVLPILGSVPTTGEQEVN